MDEGASRVVVGRYRLVRPVGRGGMGAVWHAHDTLLGRDVAIKEIWLPSAGHGPADPADPVVRRALREAQAAARLRHPGIVTVHDVVTEDGRPWIVMELINGRTLAEAISEHGLLTERRTAEIGLQVLDALRVAHREGIAHRDVKPANILLDAADRVVLTDFGIAAIDEATALTATGQMVGSPAYLAPERINGRPATAAADLWALGVTLYTAVTGGSPFHRQDTQATLAAILTSEPAPPAHAGRLWPVIKGLLGKDPARRLSAEQARELLVNVAYPTGAARPVLAGRRPRWWPARSPRRESTPDDLPATLMAPPDTLAADTVGQIATPPVPDDEAGDRAPLALYPETVHRSRRSRTAWLAAGVVGVLLLAGGVLRLAWPGSDDDPATDRRSVAVSAGASPAAAGNQVEAAVQPSAKASTPVNPSLDSCLVGTWRMTSMQMISTFEGVDARFSSSGGVTMRVWPDGRVVDDYDKSAPLKATIKGAKYVLTLRGVQKSHMETSGRKLYSSEFSSGPKYKMTRNGRTQRIRVGASAAYELPYICSETRLTSYGNAKVSTQSYQRISHTP